jgi:carboxyl-terminal processing protease
LSSRRSATLLAGVGIGLLIGLALSLAFGRVEVHFGDQSTPGNAMSVIEDSYWKQVDPGGLENSSVQGMVDYLHHKFDDRFTHYFDPKTFTAFQDSTAGHFSGIGLAVTGVKRGLRVAQVYKGSPAEQQGIEEGDIIVAVDGQSIAGEPTEASTARIKGPAGTTVTITVLRPGQGRRREITVQRAEVKIPAVRGRILHSQGKEIGYVRMATFSDGVHADLRRAITRLTSHGAKGIVLDLRGNGGGLLREAVLSASLFVPEGKVIVSTRGRARSPKTYTAVPGALPRVPMAVLVDGNTASASEILSSALEDYHLATLVGTRTYGKGTFQEVIPLNNGGGLDLTVGEYLTADGTSLAGKGIVPQIRVVDDTHTKPDEQLNRALAVVAKQLP